jgi:cytochrome b561
VLLLLVPRERLLPSVLLLVVVLIRLVLAAGLPTSRLSPRPPLLLSAMIWCLLRWVLLLLLLLLLLAGILTAETALPLLLLMLVMLILVPSAKYLEEDLYDLADETLVDHLAWWLVWLWTIGERSACFGEA